jgi:hypothetical protein
MFDINAVIEEYGIDSNELASILFPNAKYKKQALDRIKKYESTIDVDQLDRLAEHLGVQAQDLFTSNDWKGIRRDGYMTIMRGAYKVVLNKDGYYYSVYCNEELIDRKVGDVGSLKLNDFITYINTIINNYENGLNN